MRLEERPFRLFYHGVPYPPVIARAQCGACRDGALSAASALQRRAMRVGGTRTKSVTLYQRFLLLTVKDVYGTSSGKHARVLRIPAIVAEHTHHQTPPRSGGQGKRGGRVPLHSDQVCTGPGTA